MAQQQETTKYMYFQYLKGTELPVYLKIELGEGLGELVDFVASFGFYSLSDAEAEVAQTQLRSHFEARVLTISQASNGLERQIQQGVESDRFGAESLTPRKGYKVYRYKGVALMVYSIAAKEWTMGAVSSACTEEFKNAWRMIFNRYLGWALAPLGYVGFFGVPVEEGCLILKARESLGECVFIDVMRARVLSLDGEQMLGPKFNFIRLGATLKGRAVKMTKEDLFSFLCLSTSYFDYDGLPVPVRQMIQVLARTVGGVVESRETFNPRTDLAL